MLKVLSLATAAALICFTAVPVSAQRVIEDPGRCAQFYPNANCENYGAGNPYTSYGYATRYGSSHGPHSYHHRDCYRHWR
jgi:hypothetical protein